ncbi:MAG TPA: hypothetical protein VM939_02050 [Gemmatimonadaceae bacterium]|nr:hypothetical protein [Gemmatimonadaceae bacterium]
MVKAFVAILFCAALASNASGQIRRPVRIEDPSFWLSAGVGLFQANAITDGATRSTWDFGQASSAQYRLAVEKAIANHSAIGIVATYVDAPFSYYGRIDDQLFRSDAHMDVVSLGLTFHAGGGVGLHQVLEASAGMAQYRNLRDDDTGAALPPVGGNSDPFFVFGYGFGYGINSRMKINVVQDIGFVLHERKGLSSDEGSTLRLRPIRVNFRYGFGRRSGI